MTVQLSVTHLLGQIEAGQQDAQNVLFELAFSELRAVARRMMWHERAEHTLQPTALVNEAAIRILGADDLNNIANRKYFFSVMATTMRRVLIDHARSVGASKRGGDRQRESFTLVMSGICQDDQPIDLIDLDEALQQLESFHPRQSEIVTLRFFGGLSMEEIAEQLEVSLSTVEKDWRCARAWLGRQLAA